MHLSGTLQAGETATINLALTDGTTTSADHADFTTAVNNAVAAYNANSANSGTLAYSGGVLTFTSNGLGTTPGVMSDLVINLVAVTDGLVEGPENYQVALSNPGTTTGSAVALAPPLGHHHHHRRQRRDLVAHGRPERHRRQHCELHRATPPARCRRARRRRSIWLSPTAPPPALTMRASRRRCRLR